MNEHADARKTEIAGLYNRVATTYGRVGPDAFSAMGHRLVDLMGIAEDDQVLDVAAGRGANLFAALERVKSVGHVTGIDLAEKMVQETAQELQRRNLHNASVQQMDAEHLLFRDAMFDDLLCGFAIFLFPHLQQALSEFARVLRPGSKLGITVGHNPDAISQWYGKRITEYHDTYHFPLNAGGNAIDYASLPDLLRHTGFADVQVIQEESDIVYADTQQWWSSRWTHGPRYSLEHMPPKVLAQFKREVFARLAENPQPDGIHETWQTQYIIATKAL